jgi:hypothetical protein
MTDELDIAGVSREDVPALLAEVRRLREALVDAVEGMQDMIGYVPDYFRKKWDHDGYLARGDKALDPSGDGAEAEPLGEDSPSVEG